MPIVRVISRALRRDRRPVGRRGRSRRKPEHHAPGVDAAGQIQRRAVRDVTAAVDDANLAERDQPLDSGGDHPVRAVPFEQIGHRHAAAPRQLEQQVHVQRRLGDVHDIDVENRRAPRRRPPDTRTRRALSSGPGPRSKAPSRHATAATRRRRCASSATNAEEWAVGFAPARSSARYAIACATNMRIGLQREAARAREPGDGISAAPAVGQSDGMTVEQDEPRQPTRLAARAPGGAVLPHETGGRQVVDAIAGQRAGVENGRRSEDDRARPPAFDRAASAAPPTG